MCIFVCMHDGAHDELQASTCKSLQFQSQYACSFKIVPFYLHVSYLNECSG